MFVYSFMLHTHSSQMCATTAPPFMSFQRPPASLWDRSSSYQIGFAGIFIEAIGFVTRKWESLTNELLARRWDRPETGRPRTVHGPASHGSAIDRAWAGQPRVGHGPCMGRPATGHAPLPRLSRLACSRCGDRRMAGRLVAGW